MNGAVLIVSAIFSLSVMANVAWGTQVTFPGNSSTTVEGAAQVRVEFSDTYTGTLRYEIREMPAGPVTVSELMVDGKGAVIPVPVEDDRRIEAPRLFVVRILESEQYALGSSAVHTVVVEDNDAVWRGQYQTGGLSLRFDMKILRQGDAVTGALVTDGYGIIPRNADSDAWPVTHIELDNEHFMAEIKGIAIPPASSQLGVLFQRAFRFEARRSIAGEVVEPAGRIVGRASEMLTAPQHPYFARAVKDGSFTLKKGLSAAALPKLSLEAVE